MQNRTLILGAGAIGIAAARQLQQRGWQVTLIDRKPPASETSHGNAGIVSESAAVPFNNPTFRRQLPRLLFGNSPAVSWRFSYLAANLPWFIRYLYLGGYEATLKRAHVLHQLIKRGAQLHREWLADCGKTAQLRDGGWLKLYRSERGFNAGEAERNLWKTIGVPFHSLAAADIRAQLPAARAVFCRAVLIENAFAVINPSAALRAYADSLSTAGGEFKQAEVTSIAADVSAAGKGWQVRLADGEILTAEHLVLALGPWCNTLLQTIGLSLPLVFERGAHRHFRLTESAANIPLAFTDMDGGYSGVVQEDTLRMTTGVYLAPLNAPRQQRQLAAAEGMLRSAMGGIGATVGDDWYGARPTLPDCLPVIGETRRRGLWLAGGAQHIGLMTSPAVGDCLAQLMSGETPDFPAAAFSPQRFGL